MYKYPYFKVDVYSHFFKLVLVTPRGREVLNEFIKDYVLMGFVKEGRQWVRRPLKVFAARIRDGSEYRFHINQLPAFKQFLANQRITDDLVPTETFLPPMGVPANVSILPTWSLRDYQIPIHEYLGNILPSPRKFVDLQTGKGKTFIAVNFAASLKTRIAVVLKPGYIEKWVSDFKKICGMEKKEILVIQGGASLMQLIANAKEGILTHDVIIFSNRTLQLWFKAYEQEGANTLLQGYDCLPEELFPLIGVGVRIIDETHQDFHLNFKMDLYCHCAVTVSLSATLISDDPFITRMHEVAYPKEHRFSGLVYDRYIEAYSFIFNVNQPNKLRTTEWGSTNYSHHAFEESVIKNPVLLQGYMDMIVYALQRYYYDGYTPGNRALVYCASIDMCTRVKDYLKVAFPDKDVRRYVQEDPYENLMEAEISVSTLLSAGTGHDIDLLSTVILTTAVSSSASNIQGFGRLRNLPGIIKRFVYFVCADVPKHMDYHNRKKELLLVKALKYTSYTHFTRIG